MLTYCQKQPPVSFCKKVFLKISQNSQENTCAKVTCSKVCNFIKKSDSDTCVFCEFREILKNNFSCRTPTVAAFAFSVDLAFLENNLGVIRFCETELL